MAPHFSAIYMTLQFRYPTADVNTLQIWSFMHCWELHAHLQFVDLKVLTLVLYHCKNNS